MGDINIFKQSLSIIDILVKEKARFLDKNMLKPVIHTFFLGGCRGEYD